MNKEQFFDAIAGLKYHPNLYIRNDEHCLRFGEYKTGKLLCVLAALVYVKSGVMYESLNWQILANELGLDPAFAFQVIVASDTKNSSQNQLREELTRRVCGK